MDEPQTSSARGSRRRQTPAGRAGAGEFGMCPCNCPGCARMCGERCLFWRWLLGIFLLSFMFWCGLQIGYLKAQLEASPAVWFNAGPSRSFSVEKYAPAKESKTNQATSSKDTSDKK